MARVPGAYIFILITAILFFDVVYAIWATLINTAEQAVDTLPGNETGPVGSVVGDVVNLHKAVLVFLLSANFFALMLVISIIRDMLSK